MIMELKYFFILLVMVPIILVYLFIKMQGDENFICLVDKRSPLVCERLDNKTAKFSFFLPYINLGKQEGVVLDAFARSLLPKEQFDLARVITFLERIEKRRDDNYLEAFIFKKNVQSDFIITICFEALDDNKMQDVLRQMVDLTIDIYINVVGRENVQIRKTSLTILLEEFQKAAKEVTK